MSEYKDLKKWLYELQVFGIKLGLSSTESLLNKLNNPQNSYPIIHLAGTNGKGSTAAMMVNVLMRAGYKVGFYSSPHLVDMRERFLINYRMPSRERLAETMRKVRAVCDDSEPPTFFEYTTALAFLYFEEEGVDVGVIETGMGGRLDATNVVNPVLTIIQDIGLDHMAYLGDTITEIAFEKAGIIKPGIPLVTAVSGPAQKKVVLDRAFELDSPVYLLGRDFKYRWTSKGLYYNGLYQKKSGLKLGLLGKHQGINASVALAGLEILTKSGFDIREQAITEGLANTKWPGRLQVINEKPMMLLDGAHNPPACRVMIKALDELKKDRIIVVLGAMSDKDHRKILSTIGKRVDEIILTQAVYERSAKAEDLAKVADELGLIYKIESDLSKAIELGRKTAGENDLVIITGSLFIVGEAVQHLNLAPVFEEE